MTKDTSVVGVRGGGGGGEVPTDANGQKGSNGD